MPRKKKVEEEVKKPLATQASATAKTVRVTSRKAKLVLDLIRGKDFKTAEAILEYNASPSAKPVLDVLRSAGANAENNQGLNKADLYVAETFADGGPTLKRHQPVSKGRAHAILKRTSHITVILDERGAKA